MKKYGFRIALQYSESSAHIADANTPYLHTKLWFKIALQSRGTVKAVHHVVHISHQIRLTMHFTDQIVASSSSHVVVKFIVFNILSLFFNLGKANIRIKSFY